MENNQYIVAIEIGSTKIVGAIAAKNSMGYLSVSHLEEEKITNCVRHGCVGNVENTKNAISRIVRKLANDAGVQETDINEVYAGISGRSMHSVKTEVDRNLDPSVQISRATVDSLIKSADSEPISESPTIEIVPRTYMVDDSVTTNPIGRYGSNMKIEVNRIVIKKNVKLNLERAMGALKVRKYIVTPLAVAEAVLSDEERSLGCMLVDMGAETTEVAIYKGGELVYLNTLPLGGHNLTLDLKYGLEIMPEKAERVKKSIPDPLNAEAEAVSIDDVNSKSATNYIISRTGEIIANINKQIEYAGLTPNDVKKIILVGGATKLKGIRQKFEDVTKIEVRTASYPPMLNILNHDINRMEYIEIFSLLVKAGALIPDGVSCLHLKEEEPVGEGPTMVQNPPVNDGPVEKKPERRSGFRIFGGSKWQRFKDRASSLLDESDKEDDGFNS